MSRDELGRMVLLEVWRRCREVETRTEPPRWKYIERRLFEEDRAGGPRYSPRWFGSLGATEAGRVRLLRTIYALADAGLVEPVKSEGGYKLVRLRLTEAGEQAAAELRAATTAPAAIV